MKTVEQMFYEVTKYNGTWTVTSLRTNEHRTFKIKNPKWAKGKRVISLMTGPDNVNSYTQFGFVNEAGITVWKKYEGTLYEAYARMMNNLKQLEADGKVLVQASVRCRKCSRKLTEPKSIALGIGPICRGEGV